MDAGTLNATCRRSAQRGLAAGFFVVLGLTRQSRGRGAEGPEISGSCRRAGKRTESHAQETCDGCVVDASPRRTRKEERKPRNTDEHGASGVSLHQVGGDVVVVPRMGRFVHCGPWWLASRCSHSGCVLVAGRVVLGRAERYENCLLQCILAFFGSMAAVPEIECGECVFTRRKQGKAGLLDSGTVESPFRNHFFGWSRRPCQNAVSGYWPCHRSWYCAPRHCPWRHHLPVPEW
jgi:hypothetical protein